MRHTVPHAIAMLVSASIPACVASTDVEDVTELAGFWVASHAIWSELADPTNRFDLIAEGFGVTMDIEPSGAPGYSRYNSVS
jgi:hypothetical protein